MHMKIAIDFDGTIVEPRYPEIGKEIVFAFDALRELQKRGHQLILWTSRAGKELDDAVEYCRRKGIEFYAVNKNYPEEQYDPTDSRKILADIYIDDRIIGGFPGWGEILQAMHPDDPEYRKQIARSMQASSRGRIKRILSLFK
jgi:hydroxymethylpyrimidine pyrophosphatase-like HAD family hydrolase